jgi:peptidoglycan hydrolase CwlO-like protein
MDEATMWIIIIAAVVLIALIILVSLIIYYRKKSAKGPSHIELYFDENFRTIIDEWDMVSRDRIKLFRTDMSKRLKGIGGNIDNLENKRDTLDKRMDRLERDMTRMEGF